MEYNADTMARFLGDCTDTQAVQFAYYLLANGWEIDTREDTGEIYNSTTYIGMTDNERLDAIHACFD